MLSNNIFHPSKVQENYVCQEIANGKQESIQYITQQHEIIFLFLFSRDSDLTSTNVSLSVCQSVRKQYVKIASTS